MADLKTSLRRWRFPSQSHNTNLTPTTTTTSPLAWFHMIATIAAITEKGQRSQGSYGNHSSAIAAIAAIVARASTHHAHSLPSFTVFTSSSYFALIKWVEGDKFKSQRQGKGSTPIHYKLAICHGLKLAFVNKFHSFFHSTFFCSNSIA